MTRITIPNKFNHKTSHREEIIQNKLLKINYDKAKIKLTKRIVENNINNKVLKEIIINNQLLINSNHNKRDMPIKTLKRV